MCSNLLFKSRIKDFVNREITSGVTLSPQASLLSAFYI
jgi:hypothetical protein